MKRFDFDTEYIGSGDYVGAAIECEDGDYVLYEDHLIALHQLNTAMTNAIIERDIMRAVIEKTLHENGHLAGGDNCTLIALKRALEQVNGL